MNRIKQMPHKTIRLKKITMLRRASGLAMFGAVCASLLVAGLLRSPSLANAACANTPDPANGTDTITMNVASAGTYYLWSRVLAPDTANNSYYLQIDGGCAIDVGDSPSIPANTWTWVNYQDGNTSSATSVSLTSGSHQVVMTGREAGVEVDRLLFLSDQTCVPTSAGDNCTVTTDTTAPSVSVTAPAQGATVAGQVSLAANASDDTGVTKVEFYAAGNLISTDTTGPYTATWDSSGATDGTHTITAKAYDAAGNTQSAAITVNVSNADTTPPNAPTNLNATATSATTVNLTWTAAADTGANQTGVTRYNVLRNGVVIAQPTTTSYSDTNRVANTTYSYVIQAVDGAGNVSADSNTATVTTPTVADTTDPTVPANLAATAVSISQIDLTWSASTDSGGSGIAGYNIYRGGTKLNSSLVTNTSYGDSTVNANSTYSYKIEAVDGAGNKSAQTAAISATTPNILRGDVTGPAGAPDGVIDLRDVSYLIRNYDTSNPTADISGPNNQPDGIVNIYDLSYVIRNYGG